MIKVNETMYSNGQKAYLNVDIDMDAIDTLKFIFNKFGSVAQDNKLAEELHELYIALTESFKKEDIAQEMADVLIMISQFLLCDKELSKKVIEQISFKLERTMKRIEDKYYENGGNK